MGSNYFSAVEALTLLSQNPPSLKEFLQSPSFFKKNKPYFFKAENALKAALHSACSPHEPKRLPIHERRGSEVVFIHWHDSRTDVPWLYDQQGNYRGKLSANPYDPDSTSNPYGCYGSPFSPDSIKNPYGAGNP